MKRVIGAVVLGVVLVGCAQAPPGPVPHQTICGDMGDPPRRLDDRDCELGRSDSRYYSADPAGLDPDDFTAVGEEIDDDYLGPDDDDAAVLPWLGGSRSSTTRTPSRRPSVTAAPRTTPRATAVAPAPQSRASRPTTTRRTR